MRTENRTCRGIRRSVLIFLIPGEYAACAFASIPIGMDLQQHRRAAWERMAERYFSAEDQKRLAAVENAETLIFPDLDRGGELRQVEGNRSFGFSWNGKERGPLHAFQSGERI